MLFRIKKAKNYAKQTGVILSVFGKMLLKLQSIQLKMKLSQEANIQKMDKLKKENVSLVEQMVEIDKVAAQLEKFTIIKKKK